MIFSNLRTDIFLSLYILRRQDQVAAFKIFFFCGPMIWYNKNFDATDLWHDVKVNPEIMDYLWGKVFREINIKNDLNKLNIPVFLELGRYDYWNPPYLWETIRPNFKDLTIRVFEKSGHTPQYEEPELFDQELLQWLSLLEEKIK